MYPTEEQLAHIKDFDLIERPVSELLDFIEPIWEYGGWGFKRTHHKLVLHTGGWSGNEDIVMALEHNFMFWSMYWASSRRGGHYTFNDRIVSKELKGFVTRKRTIKSPSKPSSISVDEIKEASDVPD